MPCMEELHMEQKFSNNSLDLETLQEVHTDGEDYFLKIDSPAKALKEEFMNRKFRKGFEDGLQAIAASIDKKGGTKKRDAVLKRIGKLEGKYPSIARYYQIDVPDDGKGKVTEVRWQLHLPERQVFGTYFLRTNIIVQIIHFPPLNKPNFGRLCQYCATNLALK